MKGESVIAKCVTMLPLLIAVLGLNCCAQKPTTQAPQAAQVTVDSLAGCYELTLGRWRPWGFGSANGWFTPPSRIKLLTEHGTVGFEQNGFVLRALPNLTTTGVGRGGPSYWNIAPSNEIDFVWADGFTGITINLVRTGNELRGWVHPYSDAPTFIHRTAAVTARRIDCGTAK